MRIMAGLKTVLGKVKVELTKKDKVRDDAHEKMRKATSLSKQAILLIHQKRLEEAGKAVENAKKIITSLQGLADVIGELRRLALDALREGDVEKGEKCLETMDEIYIEMLALDEAYMLVPGLRRKNDIARRIIETTRGDITQEVRRKSLEEYLKRFEKAQLKGRTPRKGKT